MAGESRAPGPYILGIPDAFAQYLKKSFFKNFNLGTG